jgi:multiple sugar transport system substrate-binding protein
MKRRTFIGAAIGAALSLTGTACGGGGDGGGLDGGTEGGGGGAKTEMTFAAAMFAESGRGPKLQALLDKYNASQDQVTLKPASIPFSSFGTTILTQMAGGEGPDIIRFDHTDFYAAADAGLLEPLDDALDWSKYQFLPPDKHNFYDGKRYGIAFEISNYALIYNPRLVKSPPSTFEEFLQVAKEQTKGGTFGYAYRTTMPEQAGMWFDLCNYVYGNGGKWSTVEGTPTINSPEVVKAITAYKQVYDANVTPKGAAAADYRRMFAEGKVAMMIDNGGVPPIVLGQDADAPIDAAKAPMPSGAVGQVLTPLVVNKNTKSKDQAIKFYEWLLQPENQAAVQELLGASSTSTAVPRSDSQLKEMPYVKVYDAATTTGIPFVVAGQEVRPPEIRQIVVDAAVRVLQGNLQPQAAMDEAQKKVEDIVG